METFSHEKSGAKHCRRRFVLPRGEGEAAAVKSRPSRFTIGRRRRTLPRSARLGKKVRTPEGGCRRSIDSRKRLRRGGGRLGAGRRALPRPSGFLSRPRHGSVGSETPPNLPLKPTRPRSLAHSAGTSRASRRPHSLPPRPALVAAAGAPL